MNDKEKTDALIELEKIRIDKYKQTRELEFKVNIALWTFIILIGYNYKGKFLIDTKLELFIYLIATVILVLGHYFFWLVPISGSLARDNAKALQLQNDVENIVLNKTEPPARTIEKIMKDYLGWNLFLAGITLLLMIIVGVFLSSWLE